LLAGGVLGVIVAVEFALLVFVIDSLRAASRDARNAETVLSTSNRLERAVLDLETGARGFVIARQPRFLEPWWAASREYPALATALEDAVAGDPGQEARARGLAAAVRSYQRTWSDPIVAVARKDPARAAELIAGGEGKRRVDAMRRQFTAFDVAETNRSEHHRERSHDLAVVAIAIGVVALVATLALIVLYTVLALRFIVAPLDRLVGTTRRLADGEESARASVERAPELAELSSEFNAMADVLQLRRTELEAVLDGATAGLLLADLEGNVLLVNRTMNEIWNSLDLPDRGPIWTRLLDLANTVEDGEGFLPVFVKLADDPELVYESDFAVPAQKRQFHGRTGPVHDEDGELFGRIFILRETTLEREAERLKDEFVATVSHELRTPLTSIRGFVELLQEGEGGPVTADQRRFLAVVERNAQRLMRIIGDLLLIAQLDANTLRLELDELELADVAVDAVESARPSAEESGLRLELLVDEAPPVRGDRARLAQLVDNLVSNAIKFTPSGGSVEVSTGSVNGLATLQVRDTGPGMSEEDTARLFERFFRTRSASEQHVPGTGLGLAISQAIANAHGGRITVSSREGEGTTFTVELPTVESGAETGT
jgi:signal transduction histidine kinase/CHASE3 domain sensor protein